MVRKGRSLSILVNLLLCLALALSFASTGLAGEAESEETEIYLPLVMRRPVPFIESSGILDTSFSEDGRVMVNLGGGVETAYGAALQPDGKLIIVGTALTQLMNDVVVARYNPDGSLDTSFDGDGKAVTDFYGDDYGRAVTIQTDGKILVAGITWGMSADFIVGRYNADGSLDTSFGTDGRVISDIEYGNDIAYAITVQSDGKILAAGSTWLTNANFALMRYNADGTLDTSFSYDGKVYTDFAGGVDGCYSIALQPDGKILLAGYATVGSKNFALARYNTDGTLDTTFDGDGKLTTDFAAGSDYAWGVALQADNKIVAAGYADITTTDFALARYNADGSLDSSFGGEGKMTADFDGGVELAMSVAIQPDGKIVAAGYIDRLSNDDFALLRVTADGTLDEAFDEDGWQVTDFGGGEDTGYSLLRQADGKLLLVGTAGGPASDFAAARYSVDGSLDTSFSGDGMLLSDLFGSDDDAYAAVLQPDGKIVVVGSSWGWNFDISLARFNPDGSLDPTFAGDGRVVTDLGGTNEYGQAVALQADGKILVAGYRCADSYNERDFFLLRYLADGSLDTSFNGIGIVLTDFGGGDDSAHAMVVQSDGKIIVVGDTYDSFHSFALARYNPDGSLDATFNGDGMVITDFPDSGAYGLSVALQADGKIVMGGYVSNLGMDFALARYNADGSLDITFDADGMLTTDFYGYSDFCESVLIQPDGKILAGGASDNPSNDDFALARYNPDGSLDPSFDGDGKVQFDISGANDRGTSLARQPNGKIIFAGYAATNLRDFAVVRFNVDGSVDTTFGTGGFLTTDFLGNYDFIDAVLLQPDGRIIVAGNASDGYASDFAVVRYR